MVHFWDSLTIDFIPREILKEFPNLNGLVFHNCNLPVIKNDLFPKDFKVVELLAFGKSQIVSIEPLAFQHLNNLKWLRVWNNHIQSLPVNLFQSNPNLIYLGFYFNKINSVNPDFFKNLKQLKFVDFEGNPCVDKKIGCKACSVAQTDLESEFSVCFANCLDDPDCVSKSGRTETLTIGKESEKLDQIH